jgi:hypothetical protein
MYLPKSLQIASPYISCWYGQSGRQYEFGVVRSSSFRIDEPAVYLLVRHEGDMMVPLSVGQTEGGRTGPDGGTPAEWVQALAEGMTHAHLRFEARSKASRQGEVEDLVLALRPMLNELCASESDFIRLSPERPLQGATAFGQFSRSEAEIKAESGEYADDRRLWSSAWTAALFLPRLLKRSLWRVGRANCPAPRGP